MKKLIASLAILFLVAGCNPFAHDSDVVSSNLSNDADKFLILRRVVFYNGITDKYMLTIEGFCALGNSDGPKELTVTCKVAEGQYKKHFLGLSDNVTYFVEQLDSANVSRDHYVVIFKPEQIVPNVTG